MSSKPRGLLCSDGTVPLVTTGQDGGPGVRAGFSKGRDEPSAVTEESRCWDRR